MTSVFRNTSVEKILCLFLLCLVLAEKITALVVFNFRFSDIDQILMWYGTAEFAAGNFHEPCFFGQSYNTMFESLLAVPLFWVGTPAHIALPVITTLLITLPFIWFSQLLYSRQHFLSASLILGLVLWLPIEFTMMGSMSRGFMAGIFIVCCGLTALYRQSRFTLALFGFCFILGYSFNPNSLLLSIPLGAYLFSLNYKRKEFYLWISFGIIPALLFHLSSRYFYVLHPGYDLHKPWPMEFYRLYFTEARHHLNEFFGFVTPVFLGHGNFLLPFLALIGSVLFLKGKKRAAMVVFICLLMVVFSFGFKKIHHGDLSLSFSTSRMFLAIPFLMAVLITLVPLRDNKPVLILFSILCAGVFLFKLSQIRTKTDRYTSRESAEMLEIWDVKDVKQVCEKLYLLAVERNAELIVIVQDPSDPHNPYRKAAYAQTVLFPDSPLALLPSYDRRTWLLEENGGKVFNRILFAGVHGNVWTERFKNNKDLVGIGNGTCFLNNNKLELNELLGSWEITVRPY